MLGRSQLLLPGKSVGFDVERNVKVLAVPKGGVGLRRRELNRGGNQPSLLRVLGAGRRCQTPEDVALSIVLPMPAAAIRFARQA